MATNTKKTLIFTDLDGTLLDHDTYDFTPAQTALQGLKDMNIPVIVCSSKTISEIVLFQKKLNINHPFISENGSVIAIPDGYFKQADIDKKGFKKTKRLYVNCVGGNIEPILNVLHGIRNKNGYSFTGFSDMSVSQLCDTTGLDPEQAELAKQRMSTEPILWQDTNAAWQNFVTDLNQNRLAWVQGGRFISISKPFDKKDGIYILADLFKTESQQLLFTIGLGDSPNDQGMLDMMDIAVIVRSKRSSDITLKQTKTIIKTSGTGPNGWQEAMNTILNHHLKQTV